MLKTSTVEHEVESKDTSRTRSSSDMTSTSLNEASTVCSPNSPKRIRVMLSNEDRKRFYSATEYDSGSSTTCSSVGGGRVSRPTKCLRTSMMIERVSKQLWRRNDAEDILSKDFIVLRSTSEWYVSLFKLAQEEDVNLAIYSDEEIVLASIFIAFKAADSIPGVGRIRMQHLLDAFDKTLANTNILVQNICEIEIHIICLSGFDFQPFH